MVAVTALGLNGNALTTGENIMDIFRQRVADFLLIEAADIGFDAFGETVFYHRLLIAAVVGAIQKLQCGVPFGDRVRFIEGSIRDCTGCTAEAISIGIVAVGLVDESTHCGYCMRAAAITVVANIRFVGDIP